MVRSVRSMVAQHLREIRSYRSYERELNKRAIRRRLSDRN